MKNSKQEPTEQDLKCENCDEPIPCDYLNECIKKAEPNLSKIKDVDKALAEIRGISKITDTDVEGQERMPAPFDKEDG
jgi:hypothetical protein